MLFDRVPTRREPPLMPQKPDRQTITADEGQPRASAKPSRVQMPQSVMPSKTLASWRPAVKDAMALIKLLDSAPIFNPDAQPPLAPKMVWTENMTPAERHTMTSMGPDWLQAARSAVQVGGGAAPLMMTQRQPYRDQDPLTQTGGRGMDMVLNLLGLLGTPVARGAAAIPR